MIRARKLTFLFSLAIAMFALFTTNTFAGAPVKSLSYTLLQTKPHDPASFTQGLAYKKDTLFESSGLYQKSFVRVYNAAGGQTLRQTLLPPQIFAEGLTLYRNDLYILSWQAGLLHILDSNTLSVRRTLNYSGQGWGITHDEHQFFTSDGSDRIQIRNLNTFTPEKHIIVHYSNTKNTIDRLNELEFARGTLWANRWLTNMIYAINPETGTIKGELDLTRLVPFVARNSKEKVLNGIAYNPEIEAYWVTGKFWPVRYLIRINGL